MAYCGKLKCDKHAEFQPVIKVWAFGQSMNSGSPAKLTLNLKLCKKHMNELTVQDFIADDGWKRISNEFKKRNKVEPNKATAELHKKRIFSA